MFPLPTLETPRLRLRPPTQGDAEAVFRGWASDPQVVRYLGWQAPSAVNDTRAYLASAERAWVDRSGHLPWVLTLKADPTPIGMIGVTVEPPRVMVGFVLARAHWNRGFMTEALRRIVELALAQPRIYRVWGMCDVDNGASARVMEKAGMSFEGVLRRFGIHPNVSTTPRDVRLYAATR